MRLRRSALVVVVLVASVAACTTTASPTSSTTPSSPSSRQPVSLPIVDGPFGAGRLRMAQLVTPSAGWALTTGRLAWTADGGTSWRTITPSGAAVLTIRGVFFLDERHGWVIGSAARLSGPPIRVLGDPARLDAYRTVDGGSSWQRSTVDRPKPANAEAVLEPAQLDFVDARHGFAVAFAHTGESRQSADLYATDDGGLTWTARPVPLPRQVLFTTPTEGWVAGGFQRPDLYVTHDGARTWQQRPLPGPPGSDRRPIESGLHLPTFFNDRDGALPRYLADRGQPGGLSLVVYRTHDGGTTWTPGQPLILHGGSATQRVPGAVGIIGPDEFAVLSIDGTLLARTTDGGRNWSTQPTTGIPHSDPPSVGPLAFASRRQAWALSSTGGPPASDISNTLLTSSDGGRSWTVLRP